MTIQSAVSEIRSAPPAVYRAARWLQDRRLRGGHMLERLARARGWLDVRVRHDLGPRAAIDVPLRLRSYDESDIFAYERSVVAQLAAEIRGRGGPATLVDCGADIGLISARLAGLCPEIGRVIALEPNHRVAPVLAGNMCLLGINARAEATAVADFAGRGRLVHPPHSNHDHAAYLVPDEAGPIRVTTIDDLGIPEGGGLVLKIDVEGGELAAVRGALASLARASWFAVCFEAHPRQAARARVDPTEVMRAIEKARPCAFRVAEDPREIDLSRPFFEQFAGGVYNVLATSR